MILAGLDFETANCKWGSICSAGCALLEDGEALYQREWLICPACGYRSMQFTHVHGLSYWDVRNEAEFPQIWDELRSKLLSADAVVIHNARFDLKHLRSVMAIYDLPPVEFNYVDSLSVCRRLFREMKSHTLDTMAEHFGITFQHHNALEDAAACAAIIYRTGIPDGFVKHFDSSEQSQ